MLSFHLIPYNAQPALLPERVPKGWAHGSVADYTGVSGLPNHALGTLASTWTASLVGSLRSRRELARLIPIAAASPGVHKAEWIEPAQGLFR